jgi:D-psicose/D-tagatose/L-ribulose 3-epimerase
MNMLLWTDDVTDEQHVPLFTVLKEIGYDGVEIPMFGEVRPEVFEALGRRLDELGLERTAVTFRTAEDNPISPEPAVRRQFAEATKRVLDCCQASGATILCGPYQGPLGVFSGAGPTDEEWAHGVASMREVAAHAERCGVTLAVEFLNRFESYMLNCAGDAARFAREVDHPSCRMMYDTFHANIEEKNVRAAIESCSDVLAYVHVSENDRSTPGKGQVAWDETFSALDDAGYDGWYTVEAFGVALPGIAAATKIWRRMFDSEQQLARDAHAFIRARVAH